MGNIDNLLNSLRENGASAPEGLEDAVWTRIAARREAQAAASLTLKMQVAVAGFALLVGAAFGHAALPMVAASAPGTDYSETLVLSDDASLTPSMKL